MLNWLETMYNEIVGNEELSAEELQQAIAELRPEMKTLIEELKTIELDRLKQIEQINRKYDHKKSIVIDGSIF